MNLNLKNFHKIETNDQFTVLQHPEKHHQIKIAHKDLKPELKKQLEELPMKMAKGGGVKPYEVKNPNFSKPSQPSAGRGAEVPEAAYSSPKMAKDAYTEPDNGGTKPFNDVVISALHKELPPYGPLKAEKPHYPPCINPSCKSFGHSHPNCRCYGGNPEGKPSGEMQGMFAEGGEAKGFCSSDRPHEKGCQYFAEKGMVEEPAPEDTSQAPAPAQEVAPAVNPNPEQTASAPELPAAEPQPLEQTAAQQPAPSPIQDSQQHGADVTNHLINEDAATKADINSGHITAHTYADIMGSKDTLGKIGTLFGMLVGGAGAGLSHQPNMLMQMMDQTIQNDLKAQQESAGNKQNLLRINQQNLANNANVGLTKQQAQSVALANTYMNTNRIALDSLVKANSKLPEGSPQRQQGDALLATLAQHVDMKNQTIASQAGMAAALAHAANLGGGQGGPNTTFMKSGMMGENFKELGNDIEQKTLSGVPEVKGQQAARPVPQQVRDQAQAMQVLDNKGKDLLNYVEQNRGTLNPQKRAVALQKIEEMKNFYNSSIQGGALTEGRLGWYDQQFTKHPTDILPQLLGSTAKLKEMVNSNNMRKKTLLENAGFQPKQEAQSQAPSAPLERIDKNGKTWLYDSQTKKPLGAK